jgi:hypothetical protein
MAEGVRRKTTNSASSTPKPPATRTPARTPPKKKKATADGEPTGLTKSQKGDTGAATSRKLTPPAIQFILDMTVAGYSNAEVLKALRAEFGVTVNENMLAYHRNKNADKLAQSYAAELETARARTGLAFLARRLVVAEELIEKESKKKKPSLYGVATLLSAADTAIHRAETRKIKYEEMVRRYKEGDDGQKSEILAAIERRTALINELNRVEEEMLAIVDADFTVVAPRRLESTKREEPKPAAAPDEVADEGEGEDDGIGENALLA